MLAADLIQLFLYFSVLIAITPLLGGYMALVFTGKSTFLSRPLFPIERLIYRVCAINPCEEMNWKQYAASLSIFSAFGIVASFLIQSCQFWLPLNPQHWPNIPWSLALNTAISFATNTNWQAYSGESTLSYLSQAVPLCGQNFLSAAVGISVLLAFTRALLRKNTHLIGNFWVDATRAVLYVLLPLSIVLAVLLMSQGVVQSFSSYLSITTVEGQTQIIPQGPVASQVAIKQLGSNGGGFFGTNSAHSFENPTPFSNFLQMLAIFLLPCCLVHMFGIMTGSRKHAWMLYSLMMSLFIVLLLFGLMAEHSFLQAGNGSFAMEGKETRFGVMNSVLWSLATTAASNGSVNGALDSLSPAAGGIALMQILLSGVIFGGVGLGFCSLMLFVFLTIFLAGLMVGRTPEYFGKKIEAVEIQMVLLALIIPHAIILLGCALSCILPAALVPLNNYGPHGFSEILYAWASTAQNNGSAFAGLNANVPYYNLFLSIAMLAGRFGVIFPILAICGSLASKKTAPSSSTSFQTQSTTFAILLLTVILLIGALIFLPALSLGPVVEHFLMNFGSSF